MNNFAISAGGIGEAMQRSASALAVANNSFEESIALITAMNEVIQDTETTGTTLKVLSLRLRGASIELEEAGESTDGMAESTSKLREKIAALTNVSGKGGFDILTESGDFKSTYDIMKGIAQVWGDMDDKSHAALLELIAGKCLASVYRNIHNRMNLIAGNTLEPCTTIYEKLLYEGFKTQGLVVLQPSPLTDYVDHTLIRRGERFRDQIRVEL